MLNNDFIYNYFCKPVENYAGYNPVNTIVYVSLLLVISIFIVLPLLRKMNVKPDKRLMLSLIPYILFGSALRIIEDMRIIKRSCSPLEIGFYSYTPGIYLLVFGITIVSLLLTKKIYGENYSKKFALIGFAFALPVLVFDLMYFREFFGVISALALAFLLYFVFKFAAEKIKKGFFADLLNRLALFSQSLDGSATFVATQLLNCGEQHVLSNAILKNFPFAFPLIKIILIIALLYAIDNSIKNKDLKNFIKIVVIIVAFATSFRDVLTIGVGSCS